MAASEQRVPDHVLAYLRDQKTLTLATASAAGEPHAATFVYASDGVDLYIWAKPSSTTALHLEENPRVGFAIDEYSSDWRQTKGIQGSGRCEPVTGDDVARAAMMFGDKFPEVSPGGSTANIAFYRLRPSQLQFIDNIGSEKRMDEFGFDYRRESVLDASAPGEA